MRGVFGVEILGHLGIGMWEQKMKDLLRPLKAQVCPAQHQQRRDGGGQKVIQRHQDRQQNHELVLHRPQRNAPDDRQLPIRRKPMDVLGRHRSIVDHHARRLGTRLGRRRRDVIDAGRRHLGNRRDVIQQRQKSTHRLNLLPSPPLSTPRSLLRQSL